MRSSIRVVHPARISFTEKLQNLNPTGHPLRPSHQTQREQGAVPTKVEAIVSTKPRAASAHRSCWADDGGTAALGGKDFRGVEEIVGENSVRVSIWMTRRPRVLAFLADRSG